MSAADVSISLPYLVTIMKTVVLQACLNTSERWIFILPAWFLFSCVSWSSLPSYLFGGALVPKAPSILLHPAAENGSWQEEKLPQEALPDRVIVVLTSGVITKEG